MVKMELQILFQITVYILGSYVNTNSELKINNLAIYPNPSRGIFNLYLNFENFENEDIRINITNPLGELIFTKMQKQNW